MKMVPKLMYPALVVQAVCVVLKMSGGYSPELEYVVGAGVLSPVLVYVGMGFSLESARDKIIYAVINSLIIALNLIVFTLVGVFLNDRQ
jgi:hypothetical protein